MSALDNGYSFYDDGENEHEEEDDDEILDEAMMEYDEDNMDYLDDSNTTTSSSSFDATQQEQHMADGMNAPISSVHRTFHNATITTITTITTTTTNTTARVGSLQQQQEQEQRQQFASSRQFGSEPALSKCALQSTNNVTNNGAPIQRLPCHHRQRQNTIGMPLVRFGSTVHFSRSTAACRTPTIAESSSTKKDHNPLHALKFILDSSGHPFVARPTDSIQDLFVKGDTRAHTVELMNAVRRNDLQTIRTLHASGHKMQCSNTFGESIIHTAARRGSYEVLRYLKEAANISLVVCCDTGRTPMHDACWTGKPNFDCIRLLLKECSDFFIMTDRRGYTPLEYIPKDAWGQWRVFLKENKELFIPHTSVHEKLR